MGSGGPHGRGTAMFFRDLGDMIGELHNMATHEIAEVIDEITEQAAAVVSSNVKYHWPVKTGLSKSRWRRVRYGDKGARTSWALINDAGYVPYVYAKGDTSKAPIAPVRVAEAINLALSVAERDFGKYVKKWKRRKARKR